MADSKVSSLAEATYPVNSADWLYAAQGNGVKVAPSRVGGLRFLERQTIIASTGFMTFTSFHDLFESYELRLSGFVPVTTGQRLCLQLSSDGGSTWVNTLYQWSTMYNASNASGVQVSNSDVDSLYPFGITGIWTDANAKFSASIEFDGLRDIAAYKGMSSHIRGFGTGDGSHSVMGNMSGALRVNSVMNALRVLCSGSVGILSGNGTLFGYAKGG